MSMFVCHFLLIEADMRLADVHVSLRSCIKGLLVHKQAPVRRSDIMSFLGLTLLAGKGTLREAIGASPPPFALY